MWRTLIGVVAWIGFALTACAEQLPLEYFTRHDEFGTLKISPDGEHLAATAGKYGRSKLVFLNTKDRKLAGGIGLTDQYEIGDFDWVSSTRVIYFLAERRNGESRAYLTGEIVAVDIDGRNQQLIYGYRAGNQATGTRIGNREGSYATATLISTLRADDRNILIAEYPFRRSDIGYSYDADAQARIVKLDVYSGRKTELGIAPLARASLLVDRDDNVRFATGYDKQARLAVIWKPTAKAKWEEFQLTGFREQTVRPLAFAPDNKSVLFVGVREGESLDSLNQLDLQTRTSQLLYSSKSVDIDGLITDLVDDTVVGVRTVPGKPEFHWLADQPTAKLYQSLGRAFPNEAVRITSSALDGKLAIVFVYSDVNPGEYFLFDVQSSKAEALEASRKWIDPAAMRPMQPVTISARDGLQLAGYLTEPAGAGPHPLIVLPHGGPHGIRDEWGFDSEVQLLANRGYAVLQVNFRGSGGYGLDFELAGHRQWGAKMQDDLTDATRWAIEKGVTSKDRVCIYGTSYGGYAALMGAVREPTLYQCAVGYAGVYDLQLLFKSGDIPDSRVGRDYLERVLGTDQADLQARSPTQNVQGIRVPILLIHGKDDFRADYQHATRLKAALEKGGKSVDWLALSGEGHGIYDEEGRAKTYERLLTFLARYLPVDVKQNAALSVAPAN